MANLTSWFKSRSMHADSADERVQAVDKLAAAGGEKAVAELTRALGDTDATVRARAAVSLAGVGNRACLQSLVDALLNERDSSVCDCLADALGALDARSSVRLLLEPLDSGDIQLRQCAASALRRMGWSLLSEPDQARVEIIQGNWDEVVDLGTSALEPLARALRAGTDHSKRNAATALGLMGTGEALQVLVDVMRDPQLNKSDHEIAAWSVDKHCRDIVTNEQWAFVLVVEMDRDGLVELGTAALDALRCGLSSPDVDVRRQVIVVLACIGGAAVLALVIVELCDQDQDSDVREEAAKALGDLQDPSAIDSLVAALKDDVWSVREAAAVALYKLKWAPKSNEHRAQYSVIMSNWDDLLKMGDSSIPSLVDALRFRGVAKHAARVLANIEPSGMNALLENMGDPSQPMSVREVVATTLADLGDTRALLPVHAMLKDSDIVVRQAAVWTLERLGWEPKTDEERALVAIAHEDWEGLAALGSAAVEPLLIMASESLAPTDTVMALACLLESCAGKLSVAELRSIAAVGDVQANRYLHDAKYDGVAGSASAVVDCKRLRELARAELSRRGVMS